MIELGDFKYGDTIYCMFPAYGTNGESLTITGLAATDIEVYKNGSVTQRASDAGYTLLDTDGIDFDALTGVHGFSIDTSDNTTAGFWAPNSDYYVWVSTVTINSQTVTLGFHFSIERKPDAAILQRTTIATFTSNTNFTLTAGSADNSAYVGCLYIVQDQASVVQKAVGVISAYTGSTKTVTGLADPGVFTYAAGDYISIFADVSLKATVPTRTLDVSTGGEAGVDWANVGSPTTTLALTGTTIATTQKVDIETIKTNPVVNAGTITFPTTATLASTTNITAGTVTTATNVTTVNGLAANVITAASMAADASTEIRSLASGTSDSGTTTTMVDAARTEADTDYWKDQWILFTSGNILGQTRLITGFNAATDTITFTPATTQAVGTHTYEILPSSKVSGVTLADTLTTYTGNTVQTGDSFARLGAPAAASVSADILAIDNLVDDLESRLGTPSNLGSGATVAANLVDIEGQTDDIGAAGAGLTAVPWNAAWDAEVQSEVVDALNVDTYAEPGQEAPPATTTLVKKIGYLYKVLRNKKTQTATTLSIFADDTTTVDQKVTVSDDGTTLTSGEIATGP